MEHTSEPLVVKDGRFFGQVNQLSIGKVLSSGTQQGDILAKANARHLVACWNFCEGIETETLERVPSVQDYCGIFAGLEDLAAGRSRPWEEVKENLEPR